MAWVFVQGAGAVSAVLKGSRQLCRSWALTHNWWKEFRKCS